MTKCKCKLVKRGHKIIICGKSFLIIGYDICFFPPELYILECIHFTPVDCHGYLSFKKKSLSLAVFL